MARPIESIAHLQPHARTQGHTSLTLVDAAARASPTTTPIHTTIHAMIVWPPRGMQCCTNHTARRHCAGSQLLGEKETLEISSRAHLCRGAPPWRGWYSSLPSQQTALILSERAPRAIQRLRGCPSARTVSTTTVMDSSECGCLCVIELHHHVTCCVAVVHAWGGQWCMHGVDSGACMGWTVVHAWGGQWRIF